MKRTIIISLIFSSLVFYSCDILKQIADQAISSEQPLTTTEVAQGLKEALRVGIDTTVVHIGKTNGYFLDQIIKINLPPETNEIISYAKKVPGLSDMIDDVILRINRSAEDAAKQAAPIFKNTITSMTIADAWGILNGADTSATNYLRVKTYDQLFNLYKPVMQKSLNKPIIAGVSAQKTWTELTGKWNQFATSVPGKILQVKVVNIALDDYVTHQALKGAFIKVGDQEKEIRTNVNARVTDILRRVFEKNYHR